MIYDEVFMEDILFQKWVDLLIEESYDYKLLGISNDHCNEISVPKFGLYLINWMDHHFFIFDDKKYMTFLLRYR